MSDCITTIIAAIVIALLLGDGSNSCSRNHRSRCSNDGCNSSCGSC